MQPNWTETFSAAHVTSPGRPAKEMKSQQPVDPAFRSAVEVQLRIVLRCDHCCDCLPLAGESQPGLFFSLICILNHCACQNVLMSQSVTEAADHYIFSQWREGHFNSFFKLLRYIECLIAVSNKLLLVVVKASLQV